MILILIILRMRRSLRINSWQTNDDKQIWDIIKYYIQIIYSTHNISDTIDNKNILHNNNNNNINIDTNYIDKIWFGLIANICQLHKFWLVNVLVLCSKKQVEFCSSMSVNNSN